MWILESGRDISTSLLGLEKPKVLLVGGLFGVVGYLITLALTYVPSYNQYAPINVIALAVILSMFIIRLIYGKSPILSRAKDGECCWIPTESASWINYQSKPASLVLLSIAVATPASYLAIAMPGSSGIVFGFVTLMLLFMLIGFKVPVTHHIALSASMVTTCTGSMEWGILFGFMGAYLGEICACMFLYRGDTHIDPPTMALAITFAIFPLFEQLNIFALSAPLSYIVILSIIVGGYIALAKCKKCKLL